LIIAYIFFGESLGLSVWISAEFIGLVLALAIFGLIVWFITREPDKVIKTDEGELVTLKGLREAEKIRALKELESKGHEFEY